MLSMETLHSPRCPAEVAKRSHPRAGLVDENTAALSRIVALGNNRALPTDKIQHRAESLEIHLMTLLTDVVVSLRKEKADLERQLARVNRAIDALTDTDAPVKKKVAAKKRTRSAASKKAVSDSMKKHWAAKKSAGRTR